MGHEDGRINKVKEEYPNHIHPAIDSLPGKRYSHDYKTLKEFSDVLFNLQHAGKSIMDERAIEVLKHKKTYDSFWDQLENIFLITSWNNFYQDIFMIFIHLD